MRKLLMATAVAALFSLPAVTYAQQGPSVELRIGNAGFGGSESLTDRRTTGAEFSGGTPDDVGFDRGSILGPDGFVLRTGEVRGDSSNRLTAPQTTGAEASGGTPSRTGGAGGAIVDR